MKETTVRDYQLWRMNKQAEYQRKANLLKLNIPPDLSYEAFLEEYEDTMPLDH